MLKLADFAGAVFDVDDTLLDNMERDPLKALHSRSRYLATLEVARRRNIESLLTLTNEESFKAFHTAKTHSLEGAIWNVMHQKGVVETEIVDLEHEVLREIADLKNKLHEDVMRAEAREIPGATAFVRALAKHGLKGKMAIASTAVRRDIDIFVEMFGLEELFPSKHIIDKHQVTHLKPHPEVFDKAFKTLGLPESKRGKVAAFEDDPRGIASAKAAGLFVFAITSIYDREHLEKQAMPPDVIADSYAEFAKLIGLQLRTP